jgi:hypothetical protein
MCCLTLQSPREQIKNFLCKHTFFRLTRTYLTCTQIAGRKEAAMILDEAEALRRRNARYIEAYATAWAQASPLERELAALAMKERWSGADRERHAELRRLAAQAGAP